MHISFDPKFTSKDLNGIINTHFQKSLTETEVVFSLKKLEWVGVEEITFLFGWIRHVKRFNPNLKRLFVELPTLNQSEPEKFKNETTRRETIRRRRTRLISLVENWKIISACELSSGEINVDSNLNPHLGKSDLMDNNWHSIIPFKPVPFMKYKSHSDLMANIRSEVHEKFKLHTKVVKLLGKYTSRSVFDNQMLSNIITTELYLNSLHHSFPIDDKISLRECYFSVALRNRIDTDKFRETKDREAEEFEEEKLTDAALQKKVQDILSNNAIKERIDIEHSFFMNANGKDFRNDSFIEFTFLDLGVGIPGKLKAAYAEEMAGVADALKKKQESNKVKQLKLQLSDYHFIKRKDQKFHPDSLILEYAFLLHSSSNPFAEQLEINGYVPRGLYFLIDLVRRYNGMVVVRSGHGAISFSFQNPEAKIRDCVSFSEEEGDFFPGTLVSIYIPAESKEHSVKISPVERILSDNVNYESRDVEYIGVADLYKINAPDSTVTTETEQGINRYYHSTFSLLNNKLDQYSLKPSLIIVDFSGCDTSVVDQKIFYYLSNTPKVNSNTALVVIHQTGTTVLKEAQMGIIATGDMLFRPIPCLISTKDVVWIGIRSPGDEVLLNMLWKYADSNNSRAASEFTATDQLKGNVVKIDWVSEEQNSGNVRIIIPTRDKVFEYYLYEHAPKQYIRKILFQEETHKVLQRAENTVYWTSGGYYQTEFIRFIEKLYETNLEGLDDNDFEFSRKVAEYLLGKYQLIVGVADFDYILSVTLSSQLLAESVRNMYCEVNGLTKRQGPKVIRLSNYYDFSSEKVFRKIEKGKKVLIVNDVISTGKLNKEIYDSLVAVQGAEVCGILCLVDGRIPKGTISQIEHHYEEVIDDKTVWLLRYPMKKYIDYTRIDGMTGKPTIISIDPVVNALNTMSVNNSDVDRLIFSDTAKDKMYQSSAFLKRFSDPDRLWIGHLHHNVAHHSYYFRLHYWFESAEGREMIKTLVTDIKKREYTQLNEIAEKHSLIDQVIRELDGINGSDELKQRLAVWQEDFSTGVEGIGEHNSLILYPLYSASEVFVKKDYRQLFDIHENSRFIVFPLGRVESSKGWRLTFPPKVLNEVTRQYNHAFVIDDGSCTGETLMQMIDSVSFLHVKRIIVLSVVGRLEDFQREFFTRLHSIQIKSVTSGKVIPVSIYFGAHFHIPVYPAFTDVCPFCEEERILKRERNSKNMLPQPVEEYIDRRLEEIRLYDADGSIYESDGRNPAEYKGLPSYIPKDIDRYKLFEYRDKLGKLASFRTFREYLEGFEDTDLEIWVAIILHEPKLIRVIEQLLPSLKRKINPEIEAVLRRERKINPSWRTADIIRFYAIFLGPTMLTYEVLKKVIKFAGADVSGKINRDEFEDSIRFISYFLWKNIKFPDKRFSRPSTSKIIEDFLKYWKNDVKPLEARLRKQGKGMQYDYLRRLLRYVTQEMDKSLPGNDPRYSFSIIKTFYFRAQADFPNHLRELLQDCNICLRKFQRIKSILEQQFDLETAELDDAQEKGKKMLAEFREAIMIHVKASLEVLIYTSVYDKHLRDNGLITTYDELEKMINQLSTLARNIDYVDSIIKKIAFIKDEYLSGDKDFAEFFMNHDAIFCDIYEDEQKQFEEDYKNDMENYDLRITRIYHDKIQLEKIRVNIHPDLLAKIFRDLFSNCIKHTYRYFENGGTPGNPIYADFQFRIREGFVEVMHKQSIKNQRTTGDGYSEINRILKHFGGDAVINPASENFEVKIRFPRAILPINHSYE